MRNSSITSLLSKIEAGIKPTRLLIEENTDRNIDILDLGCGNKKLRNSVGVDVNTYSSADIIHDIEKSALPIEDHSFDIVYSDQFLEHLDDLTSVILEIHRVLKSGGIMIASVPYFRSSYAHVDPTHKRCFTINTLDYFVEDTSLSRYYALTDKKFKTIFKFLDSPMDNQKNLRFIAKKLKKRAILGHSNYENSPLSFLFPFTGITYCLVK